MNIKKKLINFVIVTISLIILIYCFKVIFELHAVQIDRFYQIEKGMTEDEVKRITGMPWRVRKDSPTLTAYFYGGFPNLRFCTMEVYFDENGFVTGKWHDHLLCIYKFK
jgi:hypothetical protein